jgi:hypothetical protein
MHGFGDAPAELIALVGYEVSQVCLGEFQTQLILTQSVLPDARLRIEGRYVHEIRAEARENEQAASSCGPNELYRLVGKSITDVRVLSPESAEIAFSNGDTLRIVDDSRYECLVLTLADKIIVV